MAPDRCCYTIRVTESQPDLRPSVERAPRDPDELSESPHVRCVREHRGYVELGMPIHLQTHADQLVPPRERS